MGGFDSLRLNLNIGEKVKNWTVLKGFFGEDFYISDISNDYIIVKPISAIHLQKIYRRDFDYMISIWEDYLKGRIERHEIRENTRNSKYVISILHHIGYI